MLSLLAAHNTTLVGFDPTRAQPIASEDAIKQIPTLTCSDGKLHVAALGCEGEGEALSKARRLRAKVLIAARSSFAPQTLVTSFKDAQDLLATWERFLPTSAQIRTYIYEGAQGNIPPATASFVRKLWQKQPQSSSEETYCLYAHILAVFVVVRLTPLMFANQSFKIRDSASWYDRIVRQSVEMRLPRDIIDWMRQQVVYSLLLVGMDRRLDQMHLIGWPIGTSELVELKELLRELCEGKQLLQGCTIGILERVAVSRLRRARLWGGISMQPAQAAWWDDGWNGRLHPSAMHDQGKTMQSSLVKERGTKGPMHFVRVIMLGTHGALFKELEYSWRAASPSLGQREFSFLKIEERGVAPLYDPNQWLTTFQWARQPPIQFEEFMRLMSFEMINHQYIDPASIRRGLFKVMKANVHSSDALILLCTIPSVMCAALASMPWPVIMFAPTGVTVQVPSEHYRPWLSLLARMAEDPKNHFIAMGPYTRTQIEYAIGQRIPVIPVLALYVNASYTGRQSREVLVHDRTNTLLTKVLCALTPDAFPLQIVGFMQTDRQYTTFSRHHAAIHVPGCVPEQMSFYEFYKMGIPLFIPADPAYYLWPRLPFTLGIGQSDYRSRCDFWGWTGTHQLRFKNDTETYYTNYTIRCNGRVIVQTKSQSGVRASTEVAWLTPLRVMDELGNTHAMRLASSPENLQSHGGRCVRITKWPIDQVLQVWLGPQRGVCLDLDAEDACISGPVPCSTLHWTLHSYLAPPPPDTLVSLQREEPAQFERGGFGGTYWHLGSVTLARRRRGGTPRTSPFDLNTHYTLRRWSGHIDFFRYPAVGTFLSLASLLNQLAVLEVDGIHRTMQAFVAERRSTALAAWRITLEAAVTHESQPL